MPDEHKLFRGDALKVSRAGLRSGTDCNSAAANPSDPLNRPPPSRTVARGPVVPHPPTGLQHALAVAAWAAERLLTTTLRYEWKDDSGLDQAPELPPVIFCLWHNRLALSMVVHRRLGRKLAALISASRDGALLTAMLGQFGVLAVRGSSSRRGPQALLELKRQARRGYDLAITPDGPRGPRYVVQDGVIYLAQVTGLPIVPVSFTLSRKLVLRSWDRFQIPLPFARCEITLGQPMAVPRDASAADREALRAGLEAILRNGSPD